MGGRVGGWLGGWVGGRGVCACVRACGVWAGVGGWGRGGLTVGGRGVCVCVCVCVGVVFGISACAAFDGDSIGEELRAHRSLR